MGELSGDWRWLATPSREQRWRAELGKPALALWTQGESVLVGAGDALALLDARGKTVWRLALGADDLGEARGALRHPPISLPDGGLALGLPGRDLALLDAKGRIRARWPSQAELRGRPLLYVNEVFGSGPRLACAGEAILSGDPGAQPARIPLAKPAISGPLAVPRDLDRILVVVDTACQMLGIEESTKRTLWTSDLRASEVGQLIALPEQGAVAILDGSRIACWQLRAQGALPRWSDNLPAPAVGDPVLAGTELLVACASQVRRYALDGSPLKAITLPAPASAAPAVLGDLVAVASGDRVTVLRAGKPQWTSAMGAAVLSVAVLRDVVVVGLADGSVVALVP
jgi:hypothetical protein